MSTAATPAVSPAATPAVSPAATLGAIPAATPATPAARAAATPTNTPAATPAATPACPYYAVIFTSLRHERSGDGYGAMADVMVASAARQPGFLGIESAREAVGITVSYWASLDAIAAWKRDSEHLLAQRLGRAGWYDCYKVRVCRVERDYGFERPAAD